VAANGGAKNSARSVLGLVPDHVAPVLSRCRISLRRSQPYGCKTVRFRQTCFHKKRWFSRGRGSKPARHHQGDEQALSAPSFSPYRFGFDYVDTLGTPTGTRPCSLAILPFLIKSSMRAKYFGWGGIRTRGTLRYTRSPGVPNRPLWHPSSKQTRTLVRVPNPFNPNQ
jgi:hypothetical protein